jgi:hypothetical protein
MTEYITKEQARAIWDKAQSEYSTSNHGDIPWDDLIHRAINLAFKSSVTTDFTEGKGDSRGAFDAWHLATFGKAAYEYSEAASQYFQDPVWMAWQAAQSRHAAEREALVNALKLALEYWQHRQQRYKNRHPVWVEAANEALALLSDSGSQG